jgi:hypothetical protein
MGRYLEFQAVRFEALDIAGGNVLSGAFCDPVEKME